MLRRILTVLLLVACSRPATTRPGQAAATLIAPNLAVPGANKVADNPSDAGALARSTKTERLLNEALLHVPTITADVARLRGVQPITVHARIQDPAEFRQFLRAGLDVDLPTEKSRNLTRALVYLGLLDATDDLRSAIEHAVFTQAAAYYDPESREFRIVMADEDTTSLDATIAHEIQHALQDRDGGLTNYLGGRGNVQHLSSDALTARNFVIEGEATLVMVAHVISNAMGIDPFSGAGLELMQKVMAATAIVDANRLTEIVTLSREFMKLGPEVEKSVQELQDIPAYVLWPMLDVYLKGAALVFNVYRTGGWKAVDALRTDPPESTEQTLHPHKLTGKRDHPVQLTLPELAAPWSRLADPDTFGELTWRVYFHLWGDGDPAFFASDWDGDSWAVYVDGDKTVALLATAWDSQRRAGDFAMAYTKSLIRRGHKGDVTTRGNLVLIVDGCDKSDCPDLIALYTKQVVIKGVPGPN